MEILFRLKSLLFKNLAVKNTFLYFIEQGAQKVFALLIITLIARNITTEEFGLYGLIYTLYKFLPLIFSFGYCRAIGRLFIEEKGKEKANSIFTITGIVNLILFLLYIFLGYNDFLDFVWSDERFLYLSYYVFSCIFLNSISEMFRSIFQINEDAKSIAIIQVIAYVSQFIFVLFYSIKDTLNIEKVMVSIIIYELILILGYSYLKSYSFTLSTKIASFKANLSFALPFIIYSGAIWIFQISDRWILQYFKDLEEVGIYTLAFQLGNIAIWVAQPINKSLAPRIDKAFVKDGIGMLEKIHNRFLPIYLLIAVLSIILTSSFGVFYLVVIAPEQYLTGIPVMLILILGGIFRILYLPFINVIRALKKTPRVAVGSSVFMVINLLLNLMLIPWIGMYGAAIATLLSNIGLLFLYAFFVRSFKVDTHLKELNFKRNFKELLDEIRV